MILFFVVNTMDELVKRCKLIEHQWYILGEVNGTKYALICEDSDIRISFDDYRIRIGGCVPFNYLHKDKAQINELYTNSHWSFYREFSYDIHVSDDIINALMSDLDNGFNVLYHVSTHDMTCIGLKWLEKSIMKK